MAFQIKENDSRPAYVVDLKDNFGFPSQAALNLTNATSVLFKMRLHGGSGAPKVSRTMTIINPPTLGRVQHNWIASDTDTPGVYDVEFEILWNDGGVETVPNGDFLEVEVMDDLDT